jgi:predicted nucleic acid-binding protein
VGQLTLPASGRVYVDTNAIIYHVEHIEPQYSAGLPLWEALDHGGVEVETSELALLEVLVKPLKQGSQALVNLFRSLLLSTVGLDCRPVSRQVLEAAASLRALHNLKTPDAIHAATALAVGSAMFVTNDVGFRKVSQLPVVILSEVAAS